jgi:tetratricopeptide (TPR) repeat protein
VKQMSNVSAPRGVETGVDGAPRWRLPRDMQAHDEQATRLEPETAAADDSSWVYAALETGIVHHRERDLAAARRAYAVAIESRHPDAAPCALVNLGLLLAAEADAAVAKDAFEQALATGHPDAAPYALAALGIIADGCSLISDARDRYLAAIATAHPVAAPFAKAHLIRLEREQEQRRVAAASEALPS